MRGNSAAKHFGSEGPWVTHVRKRRNYCTAPTSLRNQQDRQRLVQQRSCSRGRFPMNINPVSTAKIGTHPLHPMLIPFPIAFLVGALVTDFAFMGTGDGFW